MAGTFAAVPSLALQQTMYEMGRRCWSRSRPWRKSSSRLPNKHHFVYDLSPFGLENANEVFVAADRPCGLIEATVLRDDAPAPGSAWDTVPGCC